jgi:hypothetical protein
MERLYRIKSEWSNYKVNIIHYTREGSRFIMWIIFKVNVGAIGIHRDNLLSVTNAILYMLYKSSTYNECKYGGLPITKAYSRMLSNKAAERKGKRNKEKRDR